MTSNYEAWAEGWKAAMKWITEPIDSYDPSELENPYPETEKTFNWSAHILTPDEIRELLKNAE